MEGNLSSVQIHSSISNDLLLNVERLPFSTPPHPSRSYFNTVEKFREKERELSETKKVKHSLIDKFYQKLKKQLQNNSDSKKLKENLSLMNICLKHKHARYASQNMDHNTNRNKAQFQSRMQRTAMHSKRSSIKQEPKYENVYQLQTRLIINSCTKQNEELNHVHKKMGLFNYYTKKMQRKFDESERKIKKTVREF